MKIIIFYGTDCSERTAWLPWIKKTLINKGFECIIPKLPTPENQTYQSWKNITSKLELNNDDIIISWSTGAIFSVRYLYENNIKIEKLILISGFNNYVGNIPFVDNINKDFFMQDLTQARNVANQIICIKSDNDPFISQEALNDFSKNLNAETINILNGGHFNINAGYDKFPELLNLITKN